MHGQLRYGQPCRLSDWGDQGTFPDEVGELPE